MVTRLPFDCTLPAVIYRSQMVLTSEHESFEGFGEVALKAQPVPELWYEFTYGLNGIPVGLDPKLTVNLDMTIDEHQFFGIDSPAEVTRSAGTISSSSVKVHGFLRPGFRLGDGRELVRVSGYLFNFPDLVGLQDVTSGNVSPRETNFLIDPWNITLRSMRSLDSWARESLTVVGFDVSHEVEVSKLDGGTFSSTDALGIINSLECALSLVAGGMVSIMMITGTSLKGKDCWFTCGHNLVDRYKIQRPLVRTSSVDDIRTIIALWGEIHKQEYRAGAMYRLLRMVIAGHQLSPIESAILMLTSAIELGDWILGESNGNYSHRDTLSERLTRLAGLLNVSLDIGNFSSEFQRYVAPSPDISSSAAGTLAEIRNRITHPPRRGGQFEIPDGALLGEVLFVFQEIATLLFLHLIGFCGTYVEHRIKSGQVASELKQLKVV